MSVNVVGSLAPSSALGSRKVSFHSVERSDRLTGGNRTGFFLVDIFGFSGTVGHTSFGGGRPTSAALDFLK